MPTSRPRQGPDFTPGSRKAPAIAKLQSAVKSSDEGWLSVFLVTIVSIAALVWARVVTKVVPEPYLDEVFHITQAQRYCDGKWTEWDDKITTPPGLYVWSLAYAKVAGCNVLHLREFNSLALAVLVVYAYLSRKRIGPALANVMFRSSTGNEGYHLHTAINIALCPIIFFFSGLYYTDVASTAIVLVALEHSLTRMSGKDCSWGSDIKTIVLGLLALLMRQTNVFWVVVCFGAWEAVRSIKTLSAPPFADRGDEGLLAQIQGHLKKYSTGAVHDPPLYATWPDDMLFAVIGYLAAAICNPIRVARQIWPHLTVLGLFVAFVAWNGGVVLGDKSNHVATIHLAQMLYIWPLFAFFSFPLLLPQALKPVVAMCKVYFRQPRPEGLQCGVPLKKQLLTIAFSMMTLALFLAAVKYNTIIHPFTLADNRHYMFYVFRYTIRRGGWIPFFLTLPYTICRGLVWDTLSGSLDVPEQRAVNDMPRVTASSALIWLLATALSLVTAPLVEPRYFIIPWVLWRLMVPPFRAASFTNDLGEAHPLSKFMAAVEKYSLLLWLETVWFLAVNVATMYIFLTRPYQWKAEDGTLLDDGRWQRFMW